MENGEGKPEDMKGKLWKRAENTYKGVRGVRLRGTCAGSALGWN